MTFDIPAPKISKDEFLQRIETVTAAHDFERHKDRFFRMPQGYFLAQELDFQWGRSRFGYFSGSPFLWLRLRKQRTIAYTRALNSSFGNLVAYWGARQGIERASYMSVYDNMADGPDWIDEFAQVLGAVLKGLDPIMRSKERLLEQLHSESAFSHRTDLIERVAALPESHQGS